VGKPRRVWSIWLAANTEEGQAQDSRRDAYLNDMGLSVLRFSNLDVLGNMDGVIAEIVRHLEKEIDERKTKSPLI